MPRTLVRFFLDTVALHDKPAQFMRKAGTAWESISARRALADVESLAQGLRAMGIERGDRVALLSENRYEWAIADLAILGLGAVSVPIYTTLTAAQSRYILENSGARLAIVSGADKLEKLRSVMGELPALRSVVHMAPESAASGDPRIASLEAVMKRGEAARAAAPRAYTESAERVTTDDLATIIYTSGTTGEPKGAMLTHGNIASNVESCLQVIDLGPADISLSFLPLSHIFERMAGLYAMVAAGVTIAYAENMDTVAANAVEVRPTILTGVPRFYEKVYARVMENAASFPPLRRRIFDWGLAQGTRKARARFEGRTIDSFATRLADRLVASKIRARVGGRLRYCISGGAPLPPNIMEFFFAIGIPVIEGYGLTETSPVICLNVPGRERPGSVGPAIPGVELRIGDEGEILTRGPHVMRGYFKNEEATRVALRDGWFHTGDVGRIEADGRLVITDRLKDLIVTAGGKKVAPQPLEARLKAGRWIAEAVLMGDRRPFVICLLVPNFANLEAEGKQRGWPTGSVKELLARPEVTALFQAEIDRLNHDLAPFERIKKFALLEQELSQEGGELTPTLKVKRRIVSEKFARLIETLYVTIASILAVIPASAQASGFGVYEQGAAVLGMGGAGTASVHDPSALFFNPAAMTRLDKGTHVYVGGSAIIPITSFSGADPYPGYGIREEMKRTIGTPPTLYMTKRYDGPWAFGLGVNSPYGLGVKWKNPASFTGRHILTEARLEVLNGNFSAAYRVTSSLSLSAGGNAAFSRVKLVNREIAFLPGGGGQPVDVAEVTLESKFTPAYGWNAAVAVDAGSHWKLGANFRSRVVIDFDKGDATFEQIPTGDPTFDALVASALPPDQKATTKIRLPAMWSVGLAWLPGSAWTIEGDFNFFEWSVFDEVPIRLADTPEASRTLVQNYDDSWQARFGVEHRLSDYTYRFGYYYDKAAAPTESVTPLLPDANRHGATLGFGWAFGADKRWALDVFNLALFVDKRSTEGINRDGFDGEYKSFVNATGFSLARHF